MICVLIAVNKRSKSVFIRSLPRHLVGKLFTYAISNAIIVFCISYAVSKIPLVEVALFTNTIPLFVAVLGFFMLGNRLTIFEVACLLIAFGGVLVLILGAETVDEEATLNPAVISYIILLFTCALIGFTNIWLRQLKSLNMWVPGFYSGLCYFIIFGTISYLESMFTGNFYDFFRYFEISDYFFLALTGVLSAI